MKNILIFGAGRSAWFTIDYLFKKSQAGAWALSVADASAESLQACKKDFPGIRLINSDIHDEEQRKQLIEANDIVISLLPARFHNIVALDCLHLGKHLITPSYISPEIRAMDPEIRSKGLIFLNELGLDPGIDHMSAMQLIDRLRQQNFEITGFKSYTGGLVALESDSNPWHYKISWNPYNIIRAGQDGGICLSEGKLKYIPYSRLYSEAETIDAGTAGTFGAYLNRDSLPYIDLYGLQGVNTFLRGTLRHPDFCNTWQFLVNAGLTTDKVSINNTRQLTWKEFYRIFMPLPDAGPALNYKKILGKDADQQTLQMLEFINFNSDERIPDGSFTPAETLQHLLEEKWKMESSDKDRVVMIHEIEYLKAGRKRKLHSILDISGEGAQKTAMAKTVGMPLALAAELIIENKIHASGALLPVIPEVYNPLMKKLNDIGIIFKEIDANNEAGPNGIITSR